LLLSNRTGQVEKMVHRWQKLSLTFAHFHRLSLQANAMI
jgi:hypothetical protein